MGTGKDAKAVYLLGAGRSGTTILAAILGEHEDIDWRGEIIHLADWTSPDNTCSCGRSLRECDFWKSCGIDRVLGPAVEFSSDFEKHGRLIRALLNRRHFTDEYRQMQMEIFRRLGSDGAWLADSSKYVGRALGLSHCGQLRVKFIYLVRDPRGVIFSFGKNVQTRRGTFRACAYYILVNLAAQLAVAGRLKDQCLKIRYEDLVAQPGHEIARIEKFLGLDMTAVRHKVEDGGAFSAEHVVGGNRWAKTGSASLSPDTEWRENMSWSKRLLVYVLCLPLQIINRYGF